VFPNSLEDFFRPQASQASQASQALQALQASQVSQASQALQALQAQAPIILEGAVVVEDIGAEAEGEFVIALGPLTVVLVAVEHTADCLEMHLFVDHITQFGLGIEEVSAEALSGAVSKELDGRVIGLKDVFSVIAVVHVEAIHCRYDSDVSNPSVVLVPDLKDAFPEVGA